MPLPSVTQQRARVRFEHRPAEPVDELPRMDVAAFVGFAARGPLHVPARIDSFARFEAIFGGAVQLAWDPRRGEQVAAYLRPAVRAFFDNGGERCWVVRVAEPAEASVFVLPGVITRGSTTSTTRPATARARSQGAWADGVTVATVLQARPIAVTAWSPAGRSLELAPTAERELEPWDLLRLRFVGAPVEALMFTAAQPVVVGDAGDERRLAAAGAGGLTWLSPEPPAGNALGARLHGARATTSVPLAGDVAWRMGGARVPVAMRLDTAPPPGSLVAIDLDDGPEPAWLTVGEVVPDREDHQRVWLDGRCRRVVAAPAPLPASLPVVERLRLELWARAADGQLVRAGELGFHPRHRRAWMALASDDELHGGRALTPDDEAPAGAEQRPVPARGGLAPADFPLASEARDAMRVSLPVGVGDVPLAFLGAEHDGRSALERDGLERYDARLFVDPALADTRAAALVADAERVRDAGPAPRALRGIHALLAVDEVTLVAVPDAVHRGWQRGATAPPRAPAPVETLVEPAPPPAFQRCRGPVPAAPEVTASVADGVTTVRWSASELPGAQYELEASSEADFASAWVAFAGRGVERAFYGLQPADYFFRVRATAGGETGPWSDPLLVRVASDHGWHLDESDTVARRVNGAVHRALLRMCAGRGDLLAVLALPRDLREDDARRDAAELRGLAPTEGPTSPVPPLTGAERAIASHAAMFHPWVVARPDGIEPPIALPPVGAIAGMIARRTLDRGAWIAPANQPLAGVLALAARRADRLAELEASAINVILDGARGHLTLSARTLATDPDLYDVHVRRLLALLRRTALRFGERYVFEPQSGVFRRAVQRTFSGLLGRMYRAGAFAGASPEQAFRVQSGEVEDRHGDGELGRFVIELRIAPAHPLEFLTVRLVQSRAGALAVEEG